MGRQMEFNFKIEKPPVLIKQEQTVQEPKEQIPNFEFKKFFDRPVPGQLMDEIYRYMDSQKVAYNIALNKISAHYYSDIVNGDITIDDFKRMARKAWVIKSKKNFN